MDQIGGMSTQPTPQPTSTLDSVIESLPRSTPNSLTFARVAAVPFVAGFIFMEGWWWQVAAFVLFIAASLTDFLDGYLARAMKAQSNLGQMLDPIADKLLVVAAIAALLTAGQIGPWAFWAALIILCREIFISGLREFLGSREINVPVTWVAKIKTAVQMTAIAVLIVAPAFAGVRYDIGFGIGPDVALALAGTALLWIAAGLTAYTGLVYLNASTEHLKD